MSHQSFSHSDLKCVNANTSSYAGLISCIVAFQNVSECNS